MQRPPTCSICCLWPSSSGSNAASSTAGSVPFETPGVWAAGQQIGWQGEPCRFFAECSTAIAMCQRACSAFTLAQASQSGVRSKGHTMLFETHAAALNACTIAPAHTLCTHTHAHTQTHARMHTRTFTHKNTPTCVPTPTHTKTRTTPSHTLPPFTPPLTPVLLTCRRVLHAPLFVAGSTTGVRCSVCVHALNYTNMHMQSQCMAPTLYPAPSPAHMPPSAACASAPAPPSAGPPAPWRR